MLLVGRALGPDRVELVFDVLQAIAGGGGCLRQLVLLRVELRVERGLADVDLALTALHRPLPVHAVSTPSHGGSLACSAEDP